MRKLIAVASLVLAVSCRKQERGIAGLGSMPENAPAQSVSAPIAERSDPGVARASDAVAGRVAGARESAADAGPMIVRRADMRIVAADTAKALDAVTKSVEAMGGYVAGSNVWRDGELLHARVTLRVPAERLTATLAAIRGIAKRVQNETLTSEDVSQEFVDLDARLRNLEATERELRELLVVARQNSRKASEVLAVHEQVMAIRGQIEQTKGRMRYLTQVASMSEVALEMIPDAVAQPVVQPGWQPQVVAREAARALVHAMQWAASLAIWLLIYIVPIAGTLMLIAMGGWRVMRTARERRS